MARTAGAMPRSWSSSGSRSLVARSSSKVALSLCQHHLGQAFEHDRRSRSWGIDFDRNEVERGGQPWQRSLSVAGHADDAWKSSEQRMLPVSFKREGSAKKIGRASCRE